MNNNVGLLGIIIFNMKRQYIYMSSQYTSYIYIKYSLRNILFHYIYFIKKLFANFY